MSKVGESTSILNKQRQKEFKLQLKDQEQVWGNDNENGESNHDDLLQRNECQFYNNLLVSMHCRCVFNMQRHILRVFKELNVVLC